MIVIYNKNSPEIPSPSNYISAISDSPEELAEHSKTVPEELKGIGSNVTEADVEFPFYIMEIDNKFTVLDDNDSVMEKVEENKGKEINVYIITEPFYGTEGRDEMGLLRHWHLPEETEFFKKDLP